MRARAQIEKFQVEEMELEISFRMKVSEWRRIYQQEPGKWPNSELGMRISRVLDHVTRSTEVEFTDPRAEAE